MRLSCRGGVYTLWSEFGTLRSELSILRSFCFLVLDWGRYESWGFGFCDPLMVAWRSTECMRLRWVCGGFGFWQCPFREFIFCILDYFVNVTSAWVWRPGWFFYWYLNTFTDSMRYLAILESISLVVSIGKRLCYGYGLYWPETQIPPVVGTWNFRYL